MAASSPTRVPCTSSPKGRVQANDSSASESQVDVAKSATTQAAADTTRRVRR